MSEGKGKKVRFGCNLSVVEVSGCQFNDHVFETDDPDKIKRLRELAPQGDGVIVTELTGKQKTEQPKIPEVNLVLADIDKCLNVEALDALIKDIDIKYPADAFGPTHRKAIAETINKKRAALVKASGNIPEKKADNETGKKSKAGESGKGPKASKKKTAGKGKKVK